jgi:DNA-binding NtrC family response regulator
MQIVRQRICDYGPADATVLIEGETGTGKEVTARALHAESSRAAGPFVAVNCAALPADLFESELFGSLRGAFTGASHTRPGLFDAARGGTLLLDEIGELPRGAQAKLLRVLESGSYRPLGAVREKPAEARVLAATNRDLARLCASGEFRLDLYYRVAVLRIQLPPLRERRADIPGLVEHFLARAGRLPKTIAPEAMAQLLAHVWPGNVRELRSVVERTLLRASGPVIDAFELEEPIETTPRAAAPALGPAESLRVLLEHSGRLADAATALGVSPRTLQRRLRAGGFSARTLRRELSLTARH